MKPWQKIAIAVVLTIAVLSIGAILTILAILPSPASLGKHIPSRATGPATSAPLAKTETQSPPVAAMQSFGVKPSEPAPSATPTGAQRKRLVAEKFVERYLSDDRMRSDICENLPASTAPFKTIEEFGLQVEASLLGEKPMSTTAEAVMLPIQYTLKNDAVRELVRAAENAASRGETGFVHKAQFYAQAAVATASLLSSRDELEAVSGHAYRLYALSRAVSQYPAMAADPEVGDLCRGIERSAVDGVSRDPEFDRERLSRLLSRHGIDPATIDYDPRMSTEIQITTEGGSMQVRLPWLEHALRTR